ncbi:MAG: FGGY-family carbohydrate kinase [Chloroflexi bacterium]|nr:FGGY-family carbohydrate kinase [Chloroflexota bacterium]
MNRDIILTIDNGTQSVRALLFDLQGNLLHKAQIFFEPYVSPQPGWAEQDPDVFWQAIGDACQQLWRTGSIAKERIAGVGLTTQRATVVNVGADGRPLRPAILWLDQRRTEGLKPVGGLWGLGFALAGMKETAAYLQSEVEANWLERHQPDIWANTHKYLYLSGYLTYKLTGRFADSIGCQVGYMPFDYKAQNWSKSWDWKWQVINVPRSWLPELVPPTGQLGEITPEASAFTGIPAGLPLIAAAADKACEVIGSGALAPHIGALSFGTTATINTTHQKYVEVIPLLPPYPSAVPKAYNLEVQVFRGFWMVTWFRQEFGLREEQLAQDRGQAVEELFDRLVADVPPGSMGLTLQPYWSPGLRVPGPEAKGAIIGWGDVHTRGHFYRAILEGIAYALREGKERTEKRSQIAITDLRVAGGGSQSNAAMQITADVFGLPASRPHVYEASGLGAAIDVAVGLGLHGGFDTAVSAMTRLGQTFEPDMSHHRLYNDLYHGVYQHMYQKLKPLYETIRDITGYPVR